MKNILIVLCLSYLLIGCKTQENVPIKETPPTVITKEASDVTLKNATLNGEVTDEGFSATSDRGFVYSEKNNNPSGSDTKIQSGFGKGLYFAVLNNLTVNTKYYFKSYAFNSKGVSFGEVQSFTTADYKLPTAVTDVPKNITYTTVELGGSVTDEGGGNVSESGFVMGNNASPTITDLKFPVTKGKVSIALIVSKLNVNTKYYVRSYAINEKGIAYGNEQDFTTADYKLPTVTTDNPSYINYYSVVLGGSVTDAGGLTISERGICYGLNPSPSISDNKVISGDGLGVFNLTLRNLKDNSKYYFRSYAINIKGIGYSMVQSFNTLDGSKGFRDNTTKVVEVKSKTGRIWMDRNLGASQVATSILDLNSIGDIYQWGRPADGHQLRNSPNTTTLSSTDLPGNGNFIISPVKVPYDWRSPQNDNLWQGVNGINNPCPIGYRLPTEADWNAELLTWSSNDEEGAFASPLKLPIAGGRRFDYGELLNVSNIGIYWSSTVNGTFSRNLVFRAGAAVTSDAARAYAYSVRCIKN